MKDLQYQRICQFLEGKLNPQGISDLNDWRNSTPENEKEFQEIRFLWEKSSLSKPEEAIKIEVDVALDKVHQQLTPAPEGINHRRRFLRIASVAAAAVLFLLGGFWMLQTPEMMEVVTLANERIEVKLPDNSTVWLNENSKLKYPKYFDQSTREIKLSGNAVFEVTHNKSQPFIVQSEHVSVKVLGTKFNVISNDLDGNASIHVINGKVQVKNNKKEQEQIILTEDMSGLFDSSTGELAISEFFDINGLFWKNKTLVFSNATLEKVFEDLRKYYGVDLEIENSELLSCLVSGEFVDKTVDEILTSLQPVYNFKINKANSRNYKITNGQCN